MPGVNSVSASVYRSSQGKLLAVYPGFPRANSESNPKVTITQNAQSIAD